MQPELNAAINDNDLGKIRDIFLNNYNVNHPAGIEFFEWGLEFCENDFENLDIIFDVFYKFVKE